jgi:hypothetical protein
VRLEEGKGAGWGVREFRNLDPPREGPRPGHADFGWATKVVQRGTRVTTGRLEGVTVHYRDGRRRTFHGAQANRILQTVREARADAEPLPARYRRVQEVR